MKLLINEIMCMAAYFIAVPAHQEQQGWFLKS
jgi:hypothetical protein